MSLSFITVVSGLPRSGTSMMMQALESGGLPILSDGLRRQDEDNPKGYYEFEPVKKTKEDSSWVATAKGKAVKIIYRLLYDLPEGYDYRVIFMQRDINEVLASQKVMLERSGKQGANVSDDKLAELFKKQLSDFENWIAKQKNFSVLRINYKDMISSPIPICEKINGFLEGALNIDDAIAVVDPSLYRNRVK